SRAPPGSHSVYPGVCRLARANPPESDSGSPQRAGMVATGGCARSVPDQAKRPQPSRRDAVRRGLADPPRRPVATATDRRADAASHVFAAMHGPPVSATAVRDITHILGANGILNYWIMTGRPEQAKWLKPEEREWLVEELRKDHAARKNVKHLG